MARNGFSGKLDEHKHTVPTEDVLKVVRETLAWIGNASSYIQPTEGWQLLTKQSSLGHVWPPF